jgi:hypothetical protein
MSNVIEKAREHETAISVAAPNQHRDELRATLDAASVAAGERSDIQDRIAKAKADFEAQRQQYLTLVRPLEGRLLELREVDRLGMIAERELQLSCPDREIMARLGLVRGELSLLDKRIKQASGLVERTALLLRDEKNRRRPGSENQWQRGDENRGGDAARVASLQEGLSSAERELAELQAERERLLGEERDTMAAMIEA